MAKHNTSLKKIHRTYQRAATDASASEQLWIKTKQWLFLAMADIQMAPARQP